ncbi:hypothetical protein [Actinomadura parmotrematis]|uniref:Uncharacterized protein n=1 Tax=Actinomadura parmotrematis TaxID=2864039 RepID=A0ABS7FPB0_9ACTN|nr:hypothetical protein [Actinomadura parmotrematis]MBW8481403.1 hypothetical protein [Actinomadura parmotrematis]
MTAGRKPSGAFSGPDDEDAAPPPAEHGHLPAGRPQRVPDADAPDDTKAP